MSNSIQGFWDVMSILVLIAEIAVKEVVSKYSAKELPFTSHEFEGNGQNCKNMLPFFESNVPQKL